MPFVVKPKVISPFQPCLTSKIRLRLLVSVGYCRTCSLDIYAPLYGILHGSLHHNHCRESTPFYFGKYQALELQQSLDQAFSIIWTCHRWTWSTLGMSTCNVVPSLSHIPNVSYVHKATQLYLS